MELLFKQFFNYRAAMGISKGTMTRTRSCVGVFQMWLESNGVISREQVTEALITEYVAHLYSRRSLQAGKTNLLAKSTIRKHVDFLIIFSRFIALEIPNLHRPKVPFRDFPSLDQRQIDVLLALTDQIIVRHKRRLYRALFTLLLDTGLRISEALSLRFVDVNFYLRQITIIGKGDKQRIVPFSKTTLSALRDLNESEYVFIGRDGHLTDSTVRSTLTKIRDAAPEMFKNVRLSPHTLRHTFARHWLLKGGDIYSLMRILGHSNIQMTARYLFMDVGDMSHKHSMHSIFS
ncbi:tyrosine-type recombinase/integrase [Cohnella sp.]|uniref:tyrosine-type recombinase/integrase n=1 Tax=Cohnella sp. TaxID=1883426 RepID=UPI00370377D1